MFRDAIAPSVRWRIAETLDRIERDYDVRFLYVRPLDWYLSLTRGRDVIELPIVDDLDVNGWDIAKALTLLGKANPVLFEWLASPIRYRTDDGALRALQDFAGRVGHRTAATRITAEQP